MADDSISPGNGAVNLPTCVRYSDLNPLPGRRFTPGGYRITWPRTLVPRNGITWEWVGMTSAERDTLLAFIETNVATAIKWQGPEETTDRIYVPVAPFECSEIPGGLYSLTLGGIQLVYGTAITPRIIT